MWGVKWLTNGGSDQGGGTAQPPAAAHRQSGDGGRAAAVASQQPTADAASKSDADQGNGHSAGQHGTAEGSHLPPGTCYSPRKSIRWRVGTKPFLEK